MSRVWNQYFGRHFVTEYPIFEFVCGILILLDYFISGTDFSAKIHPGKYRSELGSLGTPPPLTTNVSQKYLDHLSVK